MFVRLSHLNLFICCILQKKSFTDDSARYIAVRCVERLNTPSIDKTSMSTFVSSLTSPFTSNLNIVSIWLRWRCLRDWVWVHPEHLHFVVTTFSIIYKRWHSMWSDLEISVTRYEGDQPAGCESRIRFRPQTVCSVTQRDVTWIVSRDNLRRWTTLSRVADIIKVHCNITTLA